MSTQPSEFSYLKAEKYRLETTDIVAELRVDAAKQWCRKHSTALVFAASSAVSRYYFSLNRRDMDGLVAALNDYEDAMRSMHAAFAKHQGEQGSDLAIPRTPSLKESIQSSLHHSHPLKSAGPSGHLAPLRGAKPQ